ncbi:MAG: SGNH/GDSL hydrolase family protein, partial [Acidobacteria bacterium]|nr:SGNH/GDSL hydrolase family protein [Acidobacteriota bacterium]
QYSYPALIAQQAGVRDFQQPLVSDPGLPPRLKLFALAPSAVIQPVSGQGVPKNLNLPRPYNNLAVPGATLGDVLLTVSRSDNPLFDLILRRLGTQLQQLIASNPTVVMVWIGNNDLLPAVLRATPIEGVTITPLTVFAQRLQQLVTGLKTALPNAKVFFINLPDPTKTPFATTVLPCVSSPTARQCLTDPQGNRIPLIGTRGPIPFDSLIILPASALLAQGYGIPVNLGGNGQPLPDDVVLYPDEVRAIQSSLTAFNNELSRQVQGAGFELFDVKTLFDLIAQEGYNVGGIDLRLDFLRGGLMSLDGIHPTPLGHAVLANEIIRFLNRNLTQKIPLLDLRPFITGEKGGYPAGPGAVGYSFVFSKAASDQLLQILAPSVASASSLPASVGPALSPWFPRHDSSGSRRQP